MNADQQPGAELTLSYAEDVPYEEQMPPVPSNAGTHPSLANRIGNAKVYLVSESSSTRLGKRKHEATGDDSDGDIVMDEDSLDTTYRQNALLFHGTPIAHLPTASLFAYASHFDALPMGLEWVNDNTCVLVFETNVAARDARQHLQKSATEEADADGFITAKPIPVALWPPEDRINKSLGMGEGLKGVIKMRWATNLDVKRKGARHASEFYKKHGVTAGKGAQSEGIDRPDKRRRRNSLDDEKQKAKLDADLDNMLASDEESGPPSPPSKMRSDYIAADGRTLIERTSLMRAHPATLADRITAPLPRRATRSSSDTRWRHDSAEPSERRTESFKVRNPTRREMNGSRTKKSQQELDDELDALFNERS